MIIDSTDEWGHFLHARKLIIDRLARELRSIDEIAKLLSMDPGQALLISMTPVDPVRLGVTSKIHPAADEVLEEDWVDILAREWKNVTSELTGTDAACRMLAKRLLTYRENWIIARGNR